MLKLYGFKKVNPIARGNTRDLRILWALEEMKMPFEIVGMDHPAGDLRTENYHKMNPFGQIPVIDDNGVILSESGAILIYLARKSGKLIPQDFEGESQVIRWCFAATNSLEIPLANILMIDWLKKEGSQKYREFLVGWAQHLLSGLNAWLNEKDFLTSAEFTVADLLMSHILGVVKDKTLLEPYKDVLRFRDRCLARPAWLRTLEKYNEYVVPG